MLSINYVIIELKNYITPRIQCSKKIKLICGLARNSNREHHLKSKICTAQLNNIDFLWYKK
jgi:hypothetical protein